MATNRRLAAIMFTDMVGSTALAQANESEALRLREEEELLVRPMFALHQGREIKSMGDGFLAEFDSALRATQCAVEIQRRIAERNTENRATPLRLRIGIHLGDVEQRGTDIFGDAVNIASRIQPLAESGGICVSNAVQEQVWNKVSERLEKLPPTALKGLRGPMDVYRVVLPWTVHDRSGTDTTASGIAILPFTNISPDPNDEYFADGLTEELISVISQVRELRVTSRTSIMQYKATTKPLSQIGTELGVGTILEGSVRRAGNRIRITAQLIDARSDRHLWAKTYERELNDVFAIQSEIAETTAGALRLELLGSERESIKKKPTSDFEAFNLFLKGIHAAHQTSLFEGVTESIKLFEAAIARDPNFGAAYSYLANMIISLAGVTLGPNEAFPRAEALTHKALELDPNSSDAHTALGNLALQSERNWEAAEVEFRKAISLNPSNEMAHWWYAVLLGILQRPDEGIRELETILEVDPLWDMPKIGLAGAHAMKGDYPRAISIVKAGMEVQSPSSMHHVGLGLLYYGSGQLEEARREAELAEGPLPLGRGLGRAILSALLGRPEEARALLAVKLDLAKSKYVSSTDIAELFAALGETESALEWVERDYENGERFLAFHYQSVAFDALRENPQFQSALERLRLPRETPKRSPKSR